MLNKSSAKPFKCELCHYSSKRAFDLRRHMQRHTKVKPIEGVEFKCSKCEFTTKWKRNMGRHMRIHNNNDDHSDDDNSEQPTTTVDAEESYEEFLVEFIQPNEAEYEIREEDDEQQTAPTTTEFTMKLYVCSQCNYTSNRAFDLRRHEQTHARLKITEGTAYECLKCQFRTKWKRNIVRHVKSHAELSSKDDIEELPERSEAEEVLVELLDVEDDSLEEGGNQVCSEITEYPANESNSEKRFKCAQCHYETKRAFDLRRHERRHEKVKTVDGTAVKCPQCSFVTKWKRNMKRHMQQHEARANKITWEEESVVELVEDCDSEVETYSLTIEPSKNLVSDEIDRDLVSPLIELLESEDDDQDPDVLPSHWRAVQG